VITHALTRQILLEGKKSVGVEFEQGGRVQTVQANREVLLSAGPIASPQLLQVSGIGPADVLNEAGIAVKHELPGVGQNLQDHLELYFQFRCKQPITLNGKLDLWSKFLIGLRWILTKKGLGATNHFESCGFVRSKAGVKWPDIQYHFLPAAMRYDGNAAFDGHGFQVHVGHNKPKSRGTIRAQSPNVKDKPKIIFNYLQQQEDIEAFRACVRLTREIIAQKAMDPYRDSEIQPGEAIQSDEEIDAFVRGAVESAYHPSCACRMGEDDGAVVDSNTRVHGIDNLRVVDSSIFPVILNGNLNSPTIMLAERTADIIKGKGMLEPSDAAVALAEDWEIKQRSTSAI